MMVDEQERCEWVNVSSGTGSPGQSWTKGHKMVVCVCVCDYVVQFTTHCYSSMATYKYCTQNTEGGTEKVLRHKDGASNMLRKTQASSP